MGSADSRDLVQRSPFVSPRLTPSVFFRLRFVLYAETEKKILRLLKTLLLVAIVWAIGNAAVSGQIVKKGQVGFRFLENPISAEAIVRGGLGVAVFRKHCA